MGSKKGTFNPFAAGLLSVYGPKQHLNIKYDFESADKQ